jgi:putative glutamine amidotransferase
MKPVIAISASYEDEYACLKHEYYQTIVRSGGLPVIVPFFLEQEDVAQLCGIADGLLLTGGPDVDPDYYGEQPIRGLGRITPERDRVELMLAKEFVSKGKPVFAICRGIQLLNVALGGSLYQDINSQLDPLQHSQKAPRSHLSHRVNAESGTLLSRIAGTDTFKVNSFHHQALKDVAPGLRVAARAEDGIIEAVESEAHPFVLGVQWHPEDTAATDGVSSRLFAAFVDACRRPEDREV